MSYAVPQRNNPTGIFRNEEGAIDLASIMVGIIVIGIIGGVVAATVFAVIPWTQDNAAKSQLGAIVTAESAARGLNTSAGQNRFSDANELKTQGLFDATSAQVAILLDDAKTCYVGVDKSDSDKVYYLTDTNPKPTELTDPSAVGCVDASAINEAVTNLGGTTPEPQSLMISTWDTSTTKTVTLPLRGTVDATINWGDGTEPQEVTTALPVHTYAASVNNPTITIDGQFSQWSMSTNGATYIPSAGQLRTVERWDDAVGTTNLSYAYARAENVTKTTIPTTTTNLASVFRSNTKFNGDVSTWKTGNVNNMSYIFYGASAFNQPLNSWDTKNVTTLEAAFGNDPMFNQSLNTWDTSKVTNIGYAFQNATAFNGDISNWKTPAVTTLTRTFSGASAFNRNLNTWDTSKVTTLLGTFERATSFNQPLNNWNTSNVTSMNALFQGTTVFNQNINTWDTSKVTTMNSTFNSTGAFNQPLNNWNTSNVINMGNMFSYAAAFNQNISNWNISKVTDSAAFSTGSALQPQNIPVWAN